MQGNSQASIYYTISYMHCMSVSLAGNNNSGMGLGTAWGRQKCRAMLEEAGFKTVRRKMSSSDDEGIGICCCVGCCIKAVCSTCG